jgi:hypothetical protein
MLWSTSIKPQGHTLGGEATMPFSERPCYLADSEQIRGRWRD